MKYCFFNPVEETFKLSVNLLISPRQILPTKHGGLIVMMFWTVLGWNKWTKSFTIVNKCFIYTYVQFLLTKHACVLLFLAWAKTGNTRIYMCKQNFERHIYVFLSMLRLFMYAKRIDKRRSAEYTIKKGQHMAHKNKAHVFWRQNVVHDIR